MTRYFVTNRIFYRSVHAIVYADRAAADADCRERNAKLDALRTRADRYQVYECDVRQAPVATYPIHSAPSQVE